MKTLLLISMLAITSFSLNAQILVGQNATNCSINMATEGTYSNFSDSLEVTGDSINDLIFMVSNLVGIDSYVSTAVDIANPNVDIAATTNGLADRFVENDLISSNLTWFNTMQYFRSYANAFAITSSGNWRDLTLNQPDGDGMPYSGYMAFRIKSVKDTLYGWAYVTSQVTSSCTATLKVDSYGIENNTVGIQTVNSKSNISIYPTPTKDLLYFNNLKENNCQAMIYNCLGELIYSTKITDRQINVSALPNGVYFLNINSEKEHTQLKFIKAE